MPRRNPFSHPENDPETRFDHWLDGLVSGTPDHDASRLDDPTGQLARAQSGARQLHDLAARPVTVSAMLPARQRIEEQMMHNGALAVPDSGIRLNPPRHKQRSFAWWSLNSPFVAATLIFAVLISLSGALYWVQRPAPPPPTESPGFAAASPGATPESGALSCGSPGYRPVVEGDVSNDALALIGESQEPIVASDDDITIPLDDGETTTLPRHSFPMEAVPGVYLTYERNGVSTVTNTILGESWEFDSREFDVQRSPSSTATISSIAVVGPYIVAPVDSDGFDWTILDARTGESITTSELLGGIFPWAMLPGRSAPNAQDTGFQSVQFIRASEYLMDAPPERAPEDASQVTDRPLNNTLAVILPGSVEDAAVVDLGGMTGGWNAPFDNPVVISKDHSLVAWRGWDGNGEAEGYFAIFVAPMESTANPTMLLKLDEPTDHAPIAFSPDGSALYVTGPDGFLALDTSTGDATRIDVTPGTMPGVVSIDDFANTVIFWANTGDGAKSWILSTATGSITRLPALDGFNSYAMLDTGITVAQKFRVSTPGEGSTRHTAVVNTATGDIIDETQAPTVLEGRAPITRYMAANSGHVVTFNDDGTLHVTDAIDDESWTLAPPDTGVDIADTATTTPPFYPSLTISPNGACLLFNLYQENWPGTPTTRGPIDTERIGTWIAPLEPNAEWTKLDMELIDWWAVPTESETETLPAQDFPSPIASPAALPSDDSALSCSSPGYTPIMYGEPDTTALAGIGANAIAVTQSDDAITITMADGSEFDLPPGNLSWSDGLAIVLHDDGSRTVLNPVTGQSWTFDAVTFDDYPAEMSGPNQPFVQAGPYIAGPAADNGVNWKIIDTRTGESRETADILGANFPHAAEARTPYPRGQETNGVVTLRFVQVVSIDDLDTAKGPAYTNMGATLVIGGTLDNAAFIDFTADQPRFGDKDALSPAVPQDTVFNDDRSQVAWKGWRSTGDGFGQFGLFIADIDDLDHPRILVEVTNPDTIEPVMFDPYSPSVMAFIDGELNAVDVVTGKTTPASADGLTFSNLRLINPEAGTLIFNAGTPEAPEAWLYNVPNGEARRLPELDPYMLMYPIDGWTYATAWTRPPVEPRDAIEGAKVALIDTRTGEIVSLTEEPPASLDATSPIRTGSDFGDGVRISSQANNTFLVQDTRTGSDWTLPLPAGLTSATNADPQVSPGGNCLVLTVYSNETASPTESYLTLLEPDAEWTKLDARVTGWWKAPSEPATETLPAQDFPSPIATPEQPALTQLIPDNLVPVFEPGPIGELPDPQTGGFSEAGLIMPLRNGEIFHEPTGVGISQVGHTDIAIVEHADGSRITIDLDTGETLASLYPESPHEQLFGSYQLTPADGDMANWRIVDLRTGDQVTTSDLFGGAFDQPVTPLLIALDLDHPETLMVRFVEPEQRAGELQAATPPSGQSSTVIIPGSVDDARVTELNYGRPWGEPQSVALSTQDDSTRMAYVTNTPSEVIRVADAASGEVIQTFSASEIEADGQVSIAGFFDDGDRLIAWSGATVSLLDISDGSVQSIDVGTGAIAQVFPGASSALIVTNPSAGTPTATGESSWHHLHLDSNDVTGLPDLDGYHIDRTLPSSPWVVLQSGGGPNMATVIVDRRTGEVAARLDDADLGTATSLSPAHDFSVIVITGHTGDEATTGYVLDANRGESWEITTPDFDLSQTANIHYTVSPDGSLLVASNANSPASSEANPGETWISPLQPDPEWTSIGSSTIETWLYDPEHP